MTVPISAYLVDTTATPARFVSGPNPPRSRALDVEINRRTGLWLIPAVGTSTHGIDVWRWVYTWLGHAELLMSANGHFVSTGATTLNDLTGRTTFFPRNPVAGVPFTLELAAHGGPSDPAVLLLTHYNGVALTPMMVIALGNCDAGGYASVRFPVPAMNPGDSLSFQTLTANIPSRTITWGSSETLRAR